MPSRDPGFRSGFRRRRVQLACALVATGVLSAVVAGGAFGVPQQAPAGWSAQSLVQQAGAPIQAVKSKTGRLAQSDPALLRRTDGAAVNVIVKLDYDSTATYDGGLPGLAATSPAETGKDLKENRSAVRAYERHLAAEEQGIVSAVERAVPAADVRSSYRTVYGGVAMTLPANQIEKLLAVDGVVAVQRDKLNKPLTDVTPEFLGATDVYPQLGGRRRAGEGVIVGVLDTGITPQHPSFRDRGIDHPGGTFGCEFGNGSDPQLGPSATCNDKLIGAYAFLDTYLQVLDTHPGEFCNNTTGVCSARDADGHGTHTASTAAGAPVDSAKIFGIERGPVSGIAPGAHVIAYRVCADEGCFGSDSVAAIQQAITDGVDVINFSISGGTSPYTDAVELAFLEFYEAGGLANASAGNEGPGAGTANHAGPWVNTVGASTSPRHFLGVLRLRAADGARFTATGATVTPGLTDKPVVLATAIGGNDDCSDLANDPQGRGFPPNAAAGKVVVCRRTPGRNAKAFNIREAGGVGMILYNRGAPADSPFEPLFTDNFWVPTIAIQGPQPSGSFLAFLAAHAGEELASFTTGQASRVRPDVMTQFSSRGPLGDFIKPDVTAPGNQILAGTTPTPWPGNEVAGPAGQFFQAISGTSMSSPHGAGVSALVKAAHPDWTPGQIKSAMMTSSVQDVLKHDAKTPADPFDRGAGSLRVDRAVDAPVTFDVTPAEYVISADEPLNRINLNLPSVNAPTMSGEVTAVRRLKNVSGSRIRLDVTTKAPAGSTIEVTPDRLNLARNESRDIEITISDNGLEKNKQYFGQITIKPRESGHPDVVLPVAFFAKQGDVTLSHTCAATTILRGSSTACQVRAQNLNAAAADANIELTGAQPNRLEVRNVTPPATATPDGFTWSGTLSPAIAPRITGITPGGSPAGYLPLSGFGIAPISGVGDETIVNFNVPSFKYGSETYTSIGLTSNGYAVVGGGSAEDVEFDSEPFPSPAKPNNALAPFWTDLDPGSGGATRIGALTDGTNTWLVLEWENVPTFGTTQTQSFQIWIQIGATESITYAFGKVTGTGSPEGLVTGAENRDGTSGVNLGRVPFAVDPDDPARPDEDFTITTSPPTPGGSVQIGYDAFGLRAGTYQLAARLTSDVTVGTTKEVVNLTVNNP